MGFDVLREDGHLVPELAQRVHLDAPVAPGHTVRLRGSVRAPIAPGRYRVRLDMVNELHAWFGDLGSERHFTEIQVV